MTRSVTLVTLACMAALSSFSILAQDRQSAAQREAESSLRRWLEEDVAYIITPAEEDAFKKLSNDLEREAFIENFWLRRDPTPDTIENEYKDDHYARIAYANERFTSGKPGWKTDRGRVLIVHGHPDSIDSHPSGGVYNRPFEEGGGTVMTYPFEIWTYRYIEGIGNEVQFEFIDPSLSGEYRLAMDPWEKDINKYVPPTSGGELDQEYLDRPYTAYEYRRLGTDANTYARYNQFDRLQNYVDAFRPPEIKFKDLEAVVTARLSYNTLPFEYRADYVRVMEESVMVPITIHWKYRDLAAQLQEGIYRYELHIYGKVTGINGRTAPGTPFEDTVFKDIPAALYQDNLDNIVRYQKTIFLRPGLYKLDLVIKDLHSGNIGTENVRLTVPRISDQMLATSSLIIADNIFPLPPSQITSDMFVLGSSKVHPNLNDGFSPEDQLNYWLQVYNLQVDETTHQPNATVETLITRSGREVKRIVETATNFSTAGRQMTLIKSVPLADFEPGQYDIQVKITDNIAGNLIESSGTFVVR